jgi:hypothetical protein
MGHKTISDAITPRRSPGFGNRGNGDLSELMITMRDMAAARNSSNKTQKEILMLLTKNDREVHKQAELDHRGAMMNGIEQTQQVIKNFELDLEKHKGKKQKLENVGANDDKIQKLDNEIKSTTNMIKILRAELRHQMEEMGSALKGVDDSSDEEDSD